MCSNNRYHRWAAGLVGYLSLLCVAPAQAVIQVQPLEGPQVTVDGSLGVRCSSQAGDSTGLYAQGGRFQDDNVGMIGIVIPLHRNPGDCKKILSYEEAMTRLVIAERLMEQGIISPDQYRAIAEEVYGIIGGRR